MDAKELPSHPNLEHYKYLAQDLLHAYQSGDAASMKRIQEHDQRTLTWEELRERVQRQLRKRKDSGTSAAGFDLRFGLTDAQFLIARSHAFESWPKFKKHIEAILRENSPVSEFEAAADAVITGDIATLEQMLRENAKLTRARSTRAHRSTLLHYVSANGVENFRQKTPANAVEVTRTLLDGGAEVDAENNPGRNTTLGLVATSHPPTVAGVQIALLETLLAAGASPDGLPGVRNPLTAALHNGRGDAALYLARRGARLDFEGAAGTGRLDVVESFFHESGGLKVTATKEQMEYGFMWACEYGRTAVVEFLLRRGFDVATKRGCTGLHWAAHSGHADIVKLLLERRAPIDVKDENFDGTPLGWAIHGWGDPPPEAGPFMRADPDRYYEVVALLVAAGASVDPEWLADPDQAMPRIQTVSADPRMVAALRGQMPR